MDCGLLSFLSVLLGVTVDVDGGGNAAVKEETSPYSCCDQTLRFIQRCEHTWYQNNNLFARFDGDITACVPPCKEISGGKMTLDSCDTVKNRAMCKNGDFMEETRTLYVSLPCSTNKPRAAGNHQSGPQGLLITFSLLVGWLM